MVRYSKLSGKGKFKISVSSSNVDLYLPHKFPQMCTLINPPHPPPYHDPRPPTPVFRSHSILCHPCLLIFHICPVPSTIPFVSHCLVPGARCPTDPLIPTYSPTPLHYYTTEKNKKCSFYRKNRKAKLNCKNFIRRWPTLEMNSLSFSSYLFGFSILLEYSIHYLVPIPLVSIPYDTRLHALRLSFTKYHTHTHTHTYYLHKNRRYNNIKYRKNIIFLFSKMSLDAPLGKTSGKLV